MTEWMKNLPLEVYQGPISKLCIPGSHNSACYFFEQPAPLANDQSFIKYIKWAGQCKTVNATMVNWAKTQSHSIMEQLYAGVRYFDFRIQKKQIGGDEYVAVVHGVISPLTFMEHCDEILGFLSCYKTEVVVLNVSHMYNMGKSDFEQLCKNIEHGYRVSINICPQNVDLDKVSLEQLVTKNNRLILIGPGSSENPSPIINRWPNKNNIDKLLTHMTEQVDKSVSQLRVVQGVITPSGMDVMKNRKKSLQTVFSLPCRDAVKNWIRELTSEQIDNLNALIIDEVDEEFCKMVIGLNAPDALDDDDIFRVRAPCLFRKSKDALVRGEDLI